MTLQSVMRAIDEEEEMSFDLVENFDGLSVLSDSFAEKLGPVPQPGPTEQSMQSGERTRPVNGEMWQSLLREQRCRYEGQINRLKQDLDRLQKDSGSDHRVKAGKDPMPLMERDRWIRINRVLTSYFAEYDVRF